MAERRYDVRAVKDRLKQYWEGEKDLIAQTEQLQRLELLMVGVGAQRLTDMPKSPSPPRDRLTDLLYRKQEMEEEIAEQISHQREERKYINDTLRKVRSADEKNVIRCRYFSGMKWQEVAAAVFGNCEDYDDKAESYLKRVQVLHGRALYHMAISAE